MRLIKKTRISISAVHILRPSDKDDCTGYDRMSTHSEGNDHLFIYSPYLSLLSRDIVILSDNFVSLRQILWMQFPTRVQPVVYNFFFI